MDIGGCEYIGGYCHVRYRCEKGKRAIELYHYPFDMIIATPPDKIADNKSTSAHPSGQIVDPTFFDVTLLPKVVSQASPGFTDFQFSQHSFGYPRIFVGEWHSLYALGGASIWAPR